MQTSERVQEAGLQGERGEPGGITGKSLRRKRNLRLALKPGKAFHRQRKQCPFYVHKDKWHSEQTSRVAGTKQGREGIYLCGEWQCYLPTHGCLVCALTLKGPLGTGLGMLRAVDIHKWYLVLTDRSFDLIRRQ